MKYTKHTRFIPNIRTVVKLCYVVLYLVKLIWNALKTVTSTNNVNDGKCMKDMKCARVVKLCKARLKLVKLHQDTLKCNTNNEFFNYLPLFNLKVFQ